VGKLEAHQTRQPNGGVVRTIAEELHQRSGREKLEHSLRTRSAINSGLGLSNNIEYEKLYAFVHKWLEDRDKIS